MSNLSTSALLGVTSNAALLLQGLGIDTVFDLAHSQVLNQALAIVSFSESAGEDLPNDLLIDPIDLAGLSNHAELSVESLRSVTPVLAEEIAAHIGANTIRELALWAPFQAAVHISHFEQNPESEAEDIAAEKLRPEFGTYATEKNYYTTIVMIGESDAQNLSPMTDPLSLDRVLTDELAFGQPIIGAVATYVQSWYSEAVTLGQMLHSLALAPGEATRIAIHDWTRTSTANVAESIAEIEQLDSSLTHARALSEVQSAVANDFQEGGSTSTASANSSSDANAKAGAAGIGFAIPGVVGGAAGTYSDTHQEAETNSRAQSGSWTRGTRDVVASLGQTVNDHTEQRASSVRNRRASSVREVSQSEHEQVSTRIVANYNHMHALTIQYYEVVQVYRVRVNAHKFERALFLPFTAIDFEAPNAIDVVGRFRQQLIEGALTRRAANLLRDDRGIIEIRSAVRIKLALEVDAFVGTEAALLLPQAGAAAQPGAANPAAPNVAANPTAGSAIPTERFAVRPGLLRDTIPGDAKLLSASFEEVGIGRIKLERDGAQTDESVFEVSPQTGDVNFPDNILMRHVTSIQLGRMPGGGAIGSMVLRLLSEGQNLTVVVPLSLTDGFDLQRVVFVTADAADRRAELLAHLQRNRAHYTEAVYRNLDSSALVLLLAGISFQGQSLVGQIEPRIEAVIGNFLVVAAPVDDNEAVEISGVTKPWSEHKEDLGVDPQNVDSRLVSIPTGGVFAEAVLGRSNSAEKLDITRFWNWQDSPIPLTPPEIAPIGLGSRALPETLQPGQLGSPVLNIMNPTALPDPAGLGAALAALANGDIFRDLSGLEGTQTLAGSLSANSLTAATEAGKLASKNLATTAQLASAMGKNAVETLKIDKGADPEAVKAKGGISGDGAKVNEGKKLDTKTKAKTNANTALGDNLIAPDFLDSSAPTASRERAALDTAISGMSPGLSGEVVRQFQEFASSAAVATPTSTTAPLLGASPVAFATGVSNFVNDPIGSIYLQLLELLCTVAGIDLQGASLKAMSGHKHGADFLQLFGAWTNSSQAIFMSDNLWKAGGITLGSIQMGARIAKHEAVHVEQFINNGNTPPDTFEKMLGFEEVSYAADNTWLLDTGPAGCNQSLAAIDPALVLTSAEINLGVKENNVSLGTLASIRASAPSIQDAVAREAHFRDEFQANNFLPVTLEVSPGVFASDYAVGELYVH